ncbi:MAG: hypothetical protein OSA84_10335 [Akkermansiaceae bacterium]|nr:hypothetical protein [Akkermansiaceae bacterium]
MKIIPCLLVTLCILVTSCEKEGPLGFKTGQTYIAKETHETHELSVIDVGDDWVEFSFEEEGETKSLRVTKEQLKEQLPNLTLKK